MATVHDVFSWMERDFRFRNKPNGEVEVKENAYDPIRDENYLKFCIYTDTNRYSIVAKEGNQNKSSYLGCVASSRKPRAGEDRTRGRDLADGPLDETVWRKILADIVSYELAGVHCAKKSADLTPETIFHELLHAACAENRQNGNLAALWDDEEAAHILTKGMCSLLRQIRDLKMTAG